MREHSLDSTGAWRRRLLAAVAVALTLLVGLWIGRSSGPGTDAPQDAPEQTPSSGPEVVNGVPVGYPRTEQGAIQAATNFTRVMASVPEDASEYLAAAETMAAPEFLNDARRLAQNGIEFLRDRYGDGGSFSFAPLQYRVVGYSDSEATIQVWGVTVASGPKIQGIEESWLTGTLKLVWVNDDWRLSAQESVTGPTPELLQTSDGEGLPSLDNFREYEHAPSP
jgi:hypothetical protein